MQMIEGPYLCDGPHKSLGDGGYQRLQANPGSESRDNRLGWAWKPVRKFIARKPAPEKSGKTWAHYIAMGGPEDEESTGQYDEDDPDNIDEFYGCDGTDEFEELDFND